VFAVGSDRRAIPTAWRLLLGEVRAGHRQHVGTDRGDQFQKIMAHGGEGDYSDPSVYQRTLGDLIDPTRSGGFMQIVNAVTREVGSDVSEWPLNRLLNMVGGMEQTQSPRQP